MSNSLEEMAAKFPIITIMFDDGFSSVYNNALPLLEGFGYTANVAIIGSMINKSGCLTEEQLKELLSKRWALSDHSYSHIDCKSSGPKKIKNEVMKNRKVVYDMFRYSFKDFVFPKSRVSESSLNLILSYYPIAFTGVKKIMGVGFPFQHRLLKRTEISTYETILYRLKLSVFAKRLRQYLVDLSNEKRPEWLILFTHKITDKPGLFDTSKNNFRQILGDIHSTGIPVKTTTNVIEQIVYDIMKKEAF